LRQLSVLHRAGRQIGAPERAVHCEPAFIENPFARERGNYAEETALKIDTEIKRILTEAHDKARQILRDHREILDRLSARLLEKEVIEADELKAIMGNYPKTPDTVPAEVRLQNSE